MTRRGIPRPRRWTFAAGCAALVLSVTAPAAFGSSPHVTHGVDPLPHGVHISRDRLAAEVRPAEVKALGRDRAEQLARDRIGLAAVDRGYPQPLRTRSLNEHADSQAAYNAAFTAARSGRFAEYFSSPDFGDHVALLPTGKVLLFSFESVEDSPNKETAPTEVIGRDNAGRAYVWDPAKGTAPSAFKAVPPPVVNMDDGLDEPRPAPVFCAGHSYLPNGMVGIFGGNLGGNHGTGAHLALVFDPWKETWYRQQDLAEGRWYPSVVTGADGRQFITSGHGDIGWGKLSQSIERFPAKNTPVSYDPSATPKGQALDRWPIKAEYSTDYPHLFSLRDGDIYGFGRNYDEQFVFDPQSETSRPLRNRPGGGMRNYGSAVALPNPTPGQGPDSVLILGGDRNDPKTYRFSGGRWTEDSSRAFGRTQDDTLIFPDGRLFTVNGAFDIRDYGKGQYNPNADDFWRKTEIRGADGTWRSGPEQRLPRGYHSNAVLLPDGRIMITGDELQEIANNPDIKSGMNGTIEIYEPPYLHQGGTRPVLTSVPRGPVGYDDTFDVDSGTPDLIDKAVLMAPVTSTHSVDTSQRRIELEITQTAGNTLRLRTPQSTADAPPGYYLLFLLDSRGVPSIAKWVHLRPGS
ncbi:galactose oxidase early set domain-containing protein [Streptomyces sp. L2]|uniref:galactose oxidase early set domain-containing protein n=1 Tax=Streptomyces sp. L2 TaxID=2162665 RepID=UPI0010120ECA|nr:galactose oxidase early set domain-containing protein [Streptomyces sp. L2]